MISKIHNCYRTLTATEKKLADTVLRCPEEVVNMTVQELAQCSGTVPSAVIRFCKSIGAKGFTDLKIRLSAQIGAGKALPAAENGSFRHIFHNVFRSGSRTLEDTFRMLDFEEVDGICQLLKNANRIVFFGVGTSSVIAIDAQYRLAQLGKATAACTDSLFMNVTAANLEPRDVAVGISHSGNTKATVDALRRAKNAGAATVAITSFAHSHLARECEKRLIVFSDEKNYPVEAVSARMAHMCIIDALMLCLASLDPAAMEKHIAERNSVLQSLRYK